MQKNKSITVVAVLISLAMCALLWIQFILIRNSIERTYADFDRTVSETIPDLIQEVENNNYCVGFFSKIVIPPNRKFVLNVLEDSLHQAESLPIYYYNTNFADSLMRFDSIDFEMPVEMHLNLNVEFLFNDVAFPNADIEDIHQFKEGFEDKTFKITLLDSLLHANMHTTFPGQTYQYLLREAETGKIWHSSHSQNQKAIIQSGIQLPVFEKNRYFKSFELYIYFPDKLIWAIEHNLLLIASSCIILIVFISLFIAFFKMILKERKLAEMKIDFINNISHEFKTPISNIKLAVNALQKKLPNEGQKLIEIIEEENNRLHEGMDLVLTTSLLGKEELLLNQKILNIQPLIESSVKNNQLAAKEKNGNIQLDYIDPELQIYADELHFRNVLNNLIENAIKYSSEAPIITLKAYGQKDHLNIEIIDQGKGIHARDLPYVFDRFYRVSTKNRHETYGYGIGLSYVKMIVEVHAGNINVKSKLGQGTTFRINLPLYGS